ncbi:MAG: galactokinase, partial [Tepidiformaceae bacterium]
MTPPLESALRTAFVEAYGASPAAVVRAPGRVNLIGEHTDYSDLPVLPIAIEHSLLVAAIPADDGEVELASLDFSGSVRISREQPRAEEPWQRYVVGALAQLAEMHPGRGARLLISSWLPATGGLSSSSALTMGVIAALLAAWGEPFDPAAIARRAIVAERHVGVESGGMDQTVIAFGRASNALRIDFRPPSRELVPLPEGLAFVVASSGEEAPKGGSARDAYNERVVGARVAAAMIADQVGVDLDVPITLGQVSTVDVVDIIVDGLPEKVSPQEVAHGTEVDLQHLVQLTTANFDHMAKVPVKRVAR